MAIVTKEAEVTADLTGRVDLVVQKLTELSRRKLRGLFDHGCVTVNDEPCEDAGLRVEPRDRVVVRYDPHQGYPEKRKPRSDWTFSVVYEDDHLIVVNKAANVLTVATDFGETNTLLERITNYLSHARPKRKAYVAHRLDRSVSGLLVFAKSRAVLKDLQEQFKERKPQRLYIAIVAGKMKKPQGTFRSYLDTGDNLDRFSTSDSTQGQLAITHYNVVKTWNDATLVEVRLETGRRNQIRVHFAEARHPVLGDPRYGRKASSHERWHSNRLALHAVSLGFQHPVTGEALLFESPLPPPMKKFKGSQPS